MSASVQGTPVPSVFQFDSQQVRIFVDDQGKPWFCAKDVCAVLGYTNDSKAIKDHCRTKGVTKRYPLTKGGQQELTFIHEGNLYRLILKSHKPEAERFEVWVCDEVLPAIRKTGRYKSPANPMSDAALANIRLSNSGGQWLLTFGEDGRAYLEQIERYSIVIEPKYLFKLLDAAKEIQKFADYFGLESHYGPLRDQSCDLKSEGRACVDVRSPQVRRAVA